MSEPVAIFGTGGFAREVACLLHDLGRGKDIVAFHEPDDVYAPRKLLGVEVQPQSRFDAANQPNPNTELCSISRREAGTSSEQPPDALEIFDIRGLFVKPALFNVKKLIDV